MPPHPDTEKIEKKNRQMPYLIDGYNLLHATGIFGRGIGPATLERSRSALVNFLVATLSEEELAQSTIVFDAKDAPPGLPDIYHHQGLTVRFARGYDEADDLLEELIAKAEAPRRLTVVSSDHRVQRAARRRRATAVDSGPWYSELVRERKAGGLGAADPSKPGAPDSLSGEEVRGWLKEFGDISIGQLEEEMSADEAPNKDKANAAPTDQTEPTPAKTDQGDKSIPDSLQDEAIFSADELAELEKEFEAEDHGLANPFPPGYADDLLDEE